jgi:hypothetical protein
MKPSVPVCVNFKYLCYMNIRTWVISGVNHWNSVGSDVDSAEKVINSGPGYLDKPFIIGLQLITKMLGWKVTIYASK